MVVCWCVWEGELIDLAVVRKHRAMIEALLHCRTITAQDMLENQSLQQHFCTNKLFESWNFKLEESRPANQEINVKRIKEVIQE